MFILTQVGNTANVPTKQYICDTFADLDTIPSNFGDIALCLEEGDNNGFYVCNSEGDFVHLCAANGSGSGTGGGGSSYVLPVATATRLGGVKLGANIKASQDGTITADEEKIFDARIATSQEVENMLNEIFGEKQDV